MGLFDFLKKAGTQSKRFDETENYSDKQSFDAEPPIPESEKKYYQPDEYYTDFIPIAAVGSDGNYAKMKVVTFEERKKTSTPSKNGLYVAEILLLEYCSYGTYPHPKNGYPGFWWFEYGIRNIGAKLQSLEDRGFIRMSSPKESVQRLTVPQLKQILVVLGFPTNGKKDELIQRLLDNVSDAGLAPYISERKYILTEIGKVELLENEYVPYMHKCSEKTIDIGAFGPVFNVWEVNRRLGKGKNWRDIVSEIKRERDKFLNR